MIQVHVIPILKDNYSYFVENPADQTCLVIDPGEGEGVLAALRSKGLKPVAIWNTHHHGDHVDGNEALLAAYPGLPVVGSEGDRGRIAQLTQFVQPGDELEFAGVKAKVWGVPGHTLGHIAYVFPGHVFSGDLMFGYSCGAVFEGTKEQMYHSFSQLLQLPDETLVYCGHEYTLNNRRWAEAVLGDNPDLKERLARETEPPTIPLKLGQEKRTNPFLRCQDPVVQAFTGQTDPPQVFAALRTHKDGFK